MTQDQLNVLKLACENLQHDFSHAIGVAILCIVAFVFLFMIAVICDDVFFDEVPICKVIFIFGSVIAIGVWLL